MVHLLHFPSPLPERYADSAWLHDKHHGTVFSRHGISADAIESIQDEIKQEMLARGIEELECGQYIVRYQSITRNNFDSSAFKKLMPDVYKSFIRQSTSKRFSIA